MNTSSRRIIGYNLLIMLGTGIFFRLPFWGQDVTLLLYLAPVLVAVLLAVWNIVSALISQVREERQAYWLSLLVVLLIGIGTCSVPQL